MGIKIEKISVKNCGPIKEFSENLTDLNLIYSKNEGGKSFLVEFIIQCLFKNKKSWGYLRKAGSGKVSIVGLENTPLEFGPNTRKKLEDYFEKDPRGLPPSLAKLLIVKEGETEIVKDEAGIDKNLIKEILSPRKIFDLIDNKISATVKEAKIEDDTLNIKKQGEGKRYYDIKETLEKVEEGINRLIEEYEQGGLKNLNLQKENLEQKRELLLKAKKYKAYKLTEDIKELEEKLNKIPENEIKELKKSVQNYKNTKEKYEDLKKEIKEISKETEKIPELKNRQEQLLKAKKHLAYKYAMEIRNKEAQLNKIPDDILENIKQNISMYGEKIEEKNKKEEEIKKLEEETKHYTWLKTAKENYNKFLTAPIMFGKLISLLPFIAHFILIAGILAIILNQKIFGITLILLAFFAFEYYLIKLKNWITTFKQSQELRSIKEEFKNKFGKELIDLTQLEVILADQERSFNGKEFYKRELISLDAKIATIKDSIKKDFERMGITKIEEAEWDEKLRELQKRREELLNEIQKIKDKLAKLDIDEAEYEINDPGIKFDKEEFKNVEKELEKLYSKEKEKRKKEKNLGELRRNLDELSTEIKNIFKKILNAEVSESDWENKVEELEKERNNISEDIKGKKGVLEGLGVSENEYEKEKPGIEFSQPELDKVENELKELEEKIKEEEVKLNNLKNELCYLTQQDRSIDWNILIKELYSKKEEVIKEFEKIEAQIIAGIKVHETIEELRKEEDEKLLEGLNSEEIKNLLFKLTQRYKQLSFNENDITISDEFDNFSLKDLSTGAKEQVMLALRIGFAKRILKQESAFLILDDAFQHSDYDKRPRLVDTLLELVRNGWQVIYLTMDDHIRGLFKERSEEFSNSFKEISL